MSERNIFEMDLDKNQANWEALSPLSFIRRTASVYPTRTAVVHGDLRRNWLQTYERCVLLASALHKRGIKVGDTVAVMAPNVPELLEAHFGVPMSGGVLNALNIRLDAESIAFILEHSEAKILITDTEFSPVIGKALERMPNRPLVIDINDPRGKGGQLLGECDYEAFLAQGDANYDWPKPADEWQAISLNYTSGTTGNPKGVVYHHRGAYLNAIGNVPSSRPAAPSSLPVDPANVPLQRLVFPLDDHRHRRTHVCLRQVSAKAMYDASRNRTSPTCAAPRSSSPCWSTARSQRRRDSAQLQIITAGAAAAPHRHQEHAGRRIPDHPVYGLTEVYGPVSVCAWQHEWDGLSASEQAVLKARQGVPYITLEGLMVVRPATVEPYPATARPWARSSCAATMS